MGFFLSSGESKKKSFKPNQIDSEELTNEKLDDENE